MATNNQEVPAASWESPDSHPKRTKRALGSPAFLIVGGILLAWLVVIVIPDWPPIDRFPPSTRAYSEIKGCELALTKVLSDAGVSELRDLFSDPTALDGPTDFETLSRHTDAIYALLRNGKKAPLDLRPDIRNRLGSFYMNLEADPWGHRYVFYMPYGIADDANALDRKFVDTYMTYIVLDGETRPWQNEPPVFIACRGKDGRLELFDPRSPAVDDIGDDLSNLRDRSVPGRS